MLFFLKKGTKEKVVFSQGTQFSCPKKLVMEWPPSPGFFKTFVTRFYLLPCFMNSTN
jgi:hypothetical protein